MFFQMQLKRIFFECKCDAGAYAMARPGMVQGPLNCFCMFFQMQLKRVFFSVLV